MKGIWLALVMVCLSLLSAVSLRAEDWDLAIQFTADIQGQLDPYQVEVVRDGEVRSEDVGGVARLAWAMDQVRERFPGNLLTLSCGDDLIGPYAFFLDGVPIYEVMNRLGYDAGTLGNHAFDRGDEFLAEALRNRAFPVVVANIATDSASPAHELIKPATMLACNGLQVGVFGLIQHDLPVISAPSEYIAVSPEYAAIAQRTVRELEGRGADVTVALVHFGLGEARELAAQVEGLDVILVADPVSPMSRGQEQVRRPDGGSCIVLLGGYRGEYLGLLKLKLDQGEVARYHWQPIRMDASVPQDPAMAELLAGYTADAPFDNALALSLAPLDLRKRGLRTGEAAVGSLVADILLDAYDVDVVLLNSGMFRGDRLLPAGQVTDRELDLLLPFGDTVYVFTVSGRNLLQALEQSVSSLPEPNGHFLQLAGLRFEADISRQPLELAYNDEGRATAIARQGERITAVEILGADGEYHALDPEGTYAVAANDFIAVGGDGYIMLGAPDRGGNTGDELKLVVREALLARGQIDPHTTGRMRFVGR